MLAKGDLGTDSSFRPGRGSAARSCGVSLAWARLATSPGSQALRRAVGRPDAKDGHCRRVCWKCGSLRNVAGFPALSGLGGCPNCPKRPKRSAWGCPGAVKLPRPGRAVVRS